MAALVSSFTGAGIAVPTPPRKPVEGGLFAAANVLPLPLHGELGVFYQTDGTYEAHPLELDQESCFAAEATVPDGYDFENGTPVELYAAVECTGFGTDWSEFATTAKDRLIAGEERALEEFVWDTVLPDRADDENTAGGLKAKRAVGLLETVAGLRYTYVPTLHFGRDTAADLADHFLVKFDGEKAAAIGGALAANGAGYVGKNGPDGVVAADGTEWLYITGQVTIWQGAITTYQAFDRTTNKLFAVAMRADVIAIDGFAAAARVTLE